jgi:hypothetical protein
MKTQELRKEIEPILWKVRESISEDEAIDQLLSLFQKKEEALFTELEKKIGKHAMSCKNEYTDAIKELKERKSE